ncbi:MAG: lamin tail domain-containing protein, partial [Pirellulales bacterium]
GVTSQTLATASVGDATFETVVLPTTGLVAGANLLSVEVHQWDVTSSDVTFGLELFAVEELTPAVPGTPATEIDEEWIEVFNRSPTRTIDLTGWRLDDAVDYSFPAGTSVGPGQYLVIANNAVALRAKYPVLADRIVGDFSGRLSNVSERIRLLDARQNVADEVTYHEGKPWPDPADAGGSSLELRDPWADNSRAEAWAASREGDEAAWTTVTYTGVAGPDIGSNSWSEFIFGMLDAGEVLIDDVSVIENFGLPTARELIQNGTFESDALGGEANKWRIIGNHHGTVIVDPQNAANNVLRLTATGVTLDTHNQATTTLNSGASFVSIVDGRTYQVSYRAKWESGSNLLNSRLYFNTVKRTTPLPQQTHHGTPGESNSRGEANLGPTFAELRHSPAVPAVRQPVDVSVGVADPQGVALVTLWYAVEGGAWSSLPMSAGSDGLRRATIPSQASGAIVQFYVRATDGLGATADFPAAGPNSRALYVIDDGRSASGVAHNFRTIMTAADRATMYFNPNLMSNERLGATVVYNEREVYYDVGIRLRGTTNGRPQATVGYNISFHSDQRFRGIHDGVAIDPNSLGPDTTTQDEIVSKHLTTRAGVGGMYDDIVHFMGPNAATVGSALLLMAKYEDVFLDSQYENGGDGSLYQFEIVHYLPTTTDGNPESPKLTTLADTRYDIGASIYGTDGNPENFRWTFQPGNIRWRDEFSRIVDLNHAFRLTGNDLDAATQAVLDVDEWMRVFSLQSLAGVQDVYTYLNPHNFYFYVRPSDNKVLALPWDWDANFANPSCCSGSIVPTAPLWSQDNWNLKKIIELPANTRTYYGHVYDLTNTIYNAAYMTPWTQHYAAVAGENYANILSYITARSNFARTQLPAIVPFTITTNSGADFSVAATTVTLQGNGWIDVRRMYVDGDPQPLDLKWTDGDSWQVTIPLRPGANNLRLRAFDAYDNLVGSDAITVTSTVSGRPLQDFLRVSEIMYRPPAVAPAEAIAGVTDRDSFEYIEMVNISSGPVATVLNLSGVRFTDGVDFDFTNAAITSLGPGEHVIVARNPTALSVRYGSGLPVAGAFANGTGLNNGGEGIALVDPDGVTIQEFSFEDDWYPETDGPGYSLVIVNPLGETDAWDDRLGWRASFEFNGSPGEKDLMQGDVNEDNRVDLTDLAILQMHFGTPSDATRSQGDLNRDGAVTRYDVAILARNYGRSYPPLVGSSSPATLSPRPAHSPSALVIPANSTPSSAPLLPAVRRNALRVSAHRMRFAAPESTTDIPKPIAVVLRATRRLTPASVDRSHSDHVVD